MATNQRPIPFGTRLYLCGPCAIDNFIDILSIFVELIIYLITLDEMVTIIALAQAFCLNEIINTASNQAQRNLFTECVEDA